MRTAEAGEGYYRHTGTGETHHARARAPLPERDGPGEWCLFAYDNTPSTNLIRVDIYQVGSMSEIPFAQFDFVPEINMVVTLAIDPEHKGARFEEGLYQIHNAELPPHKGADFMILVEKIGPLRPQLPVYGVRLD